MFRSPMRFIPLLLIFTLLLAAFPAAAQEQTTHAVQRGETLYRIALRYGVSMDAIAQANNLTNLSRILVGQQLVIPNFDASGETVDNPLVAGTPIFHTIQPGETLASIAAVYGMTLDQLVRLNNIINPDLIYRGQQLTVWSTTDAEPALDDPAAPQIALTAAPPVEVAASTVADTESTYVVQRGEHLSQIARRFGLSWPQLAQANNIVNPDQIFAGQTLIIPRGGVVTDAGAFAASAPLVEPPSPTIFVGRQVVVDLSDQMMYAFENGQLVRSVLVSTGLPATPTVQGDYNVYIKYEAQTMSGPGYYLPAVPYVMYFYQGYALHGTYWHNNFGNPMSRGCVNLPTPEAEWLFTSFVEVGTPVHVKY